LLSESKRLRLFRSCCGSHFFEKYELSVNLELKWCCCSVTDHQVAWLQAACGALQEAIDVHRLPDVPSYCKVESSPEEAAQIIAYAHRLSYTTFAPPAFEHAKTHLQNFRPPAPQEWQMRSSQLHLFAGLRDGRTDRQSDGQAARHA
jgi:hypothetical protein